MNIRNAMTGAIASGAALMLFAGPTLGATDVSKCSKAIQGEASKMQAAATKGFQNCNNDYQADRVKPPSPVYSKGAPKCEKELAKIGTTATAEFGKLTALTAAGKACTDVELSLLGHLTTASFQNRWATAVIMQALQGAYDQQIQSTRDFVNQMSVMGGVTPDTVSGTTVSSALCPTCKRYASAPCNQHSCKYVSAGSSSANVSDTVLDIPVPLTGATTLSICNAQSLAGGTNFLPGVTTSGELPILGGTGKQLDPANLGIGVACVKAIGAQGFITCNGGAGLKISYDTCQDHIIDAPNAAGATTSGSCTAQTICLQSSTDIGQAGTGFDQHNCGAAPCINGGACTKNTPGTAAAGDAFINNTTQIAIVLNAEVGGDGKFCTNDDTNASPGTPATTPLTTGTVSSTIFDADAVADQVIDSGSLTGAAFPCATIPSSNLTGGKFVGAFPALHALTFPGPSNAHDSVTAFTISCQ